MREVYNVVPRYVVFDPKGDFPEQPGGNEKIVTSPGSFTWNLFPDGLFGSGLFRVNRIIYRPDPKYQPTMDLRLRHLFYKARKLHIAARKKGLDISPYHFRVGVDEGLFQSKNGKRWLQSAAITGRSFNMGFDVNSQRPVGIPVEVRSEAWRMYVFYLGDVKDQKAVLDYAQGTVTLEDLDDLGDDFSFIEVSRTPGGKRRATKYPPLRLTVP